MHADMHEWFVEDSETVRITYLRAKKKVSGLSQYFPVLPQYLEGTSDGTSVRTYCTIRSKHITHAEEVFMRSEQLYIHNSPAVL